MRPSLTPESIIDGARKQAGLDDLGAPGYREALDVLCEALEREAGLTSFGRMAVRGLLTGALANRARVLDWAARHPEVRRALNMAS